MSHVFVATDLELNRQVVIKVLPPKLSAGLNADRFRREIQFAARLQHPHIVPLLAAGARDEVLYYTMPYISGQSLRSRMERTGELAIPEAAKILREVADALSYAHSEGLVHRDIKPANILISGNHALVTDFGVAKAVSKAIDETASDDTTLTSMGVALGTPAYMAPEQAAADPMIDARADIYALGVVGYELLAGKTPFEGMSAPQIRVAHIMTEPAVITKHRPQVPPGLAAIIMRCLAKRPSDRFQSAEELHAALEPYSITTGVTRPVHVARKPFTWTRWRIRTAIGIAALVVIGLVNSMIGSRSGGGSITIGNTRQFTNSPGLEVHPAISPDGQMIAYVGGPWDRSRIYVKQIAGGRAVALTDSTTAAYWPRWKPDGSGILYGSRGRHYIIPTLGGIPTGLPGLDSLFGCSFSNAGDRVACMSESNGALVIAGATGQNPRVIQETAGNEGVLAISWSPDDKLIAFVRNNRPYLVGVNIGNFASSSIWVVRADGGTPIRISDATHLNTSPVWTPEGAILFVSSIGGARDVYQQRIGGDLAPRGNPMRLTTGLNAHTISTDRSGKKLAASVLNTVANVWSTPIADVTRDMVRVRQITNGNQTIETARVSPDGQWLAFDSNLNGNQDIYKIPIGGGEAQQLTSNGADNFWVGWSPDGREISFHTTAKGNRDVYIVDASGERATPVVTAPTEDLDAVWKPDGSGIVYLVYPDSLFELNRTGSTWGPRRFLLRGFLGGITRDGKFMFVRTPSGSDCVGCGGGIHMVSLDMTTRKEIRTPKMDRVVAPSPGLVVASSVDGRHVFMPVREKDGTSAIWQLPVNGDEEKRVLHLTDPDRQFYRLSLDVDAKNFYFTLGDRQSDVWTMELRK